ncbi:SLAM family member 9-like [Megalobrama amblycephala]|uniref:SLAM family member 9-like n=1 Tax=Megalobrama amblycephala TaxID=75352 RepID=UPI0020148132|nr:SLAM family member 9-like [Megalobrama amblycephala]
MFCSGDLKLWAERTSDCVFVLEPQTSLRRPNNQMVSVQSVTLNSNLTELMDDDEIQWRFGNTLIAEINVTADRITVYDDVLDGRFRDRLKLDKQTGSLTITDTRTEVSEYYSVLIQGAKPSLKLYSVSVYVKVFFTCCVCSSCVFADSDEVKSVSVMEGDSVTLNTGLTKMQTDDLILWTFGTDRSFMARITKSTGSKRVLHDPDGELKDRLEVDHQTGSLTITNIRTTDSGLYELTIKSNTSETKKRFSVTVYAHLPFPVISRDCSSSTSSSSCSLVCSAVNVSRVTLSWYKGNRLLSSISASDLSISLSLPLEVEYQDNNTYSCGLNNPISNHVKYLDIIELCQPCPGSSTH